MGIGLSWKTEVSEIHSFEFLKILGLTVARHVRPLTYDTLNVFFVFSSTTLAQLRQLYHFECEVDFEFVRMRMFKRDCYRICTKRLRTSSNEVGKIFLRSELRKQNLQLRRINTN
jgi:hypothetical protein